jgi:putative transposase
MKSRFTEKQIIGVMKEEDAGMKVTEFCRKYDINDATYYNWKAKFGGMAASRAQRLNALEAENGKRKRLLAEAMLGNAALKSPAPACGMATM